MSSSVDKFTKLVEIEIISTSILIGFLFSMILTIVQQYRTEQLGSASIPFFGFLQLQAGIIINAYVTLLLFSVFIGMNIFALERFVFEKWERAKELHRWSLTVLGLAAVVGAITLLQFSALVVPIEYLNPLLGVLGPFLFFALVAIAIFVVARVIYVVLPRVTAFLGRIHKARLSKARNNV